MTQWPAAHLGPWPGPDFLPEELSSAFRKVNGDAQEEYKTHNKNKTTPTQQQSQYRRKDVQGKGKAGSSDALPRGIKNQRMTVKKQSGNIVNTRFIQGSMTPTPITHNRTDITESMELVTGGNAHEITDDGED